MQSARHSKEIAINPYVSGNIVRQHGKGERPRGVYFEGTAHKVTAVSEDSEAFVTYNTRLGLPWGAVDHGDGSGAHAFYEIIVSDWYVFDGVESKPSQKYHLPWNGAKA